MWKATAESPDTDSAECFVRRLEPVLPPALVGAEFVAAARSVARTLPISVTSRLGFEAHLGNPDGSADMALCVTAAAGESDALAVPELAARPSAHSAWSGIGSLARRWAEPGSLLSSRLANVWLEFDLEPGLSTVPAPAILLGLDEPEVADSAAATWRAEADRDLATSLEGLGALLDRRLPPELLRMVERCFAALPPGAKVFQVGAMLSRSMEGVRICVRRLPRDGLTSYLRAVGWTGELTRVDPLLRMIGDRVELLSLDLDIAAGGPAPVLGVECSFARQPGAEPGWQALLELLCDLDLCRPEKADALLEWPSVTVDAARGQVVVHAVSHVKLVHRPEGLAEAKAYFGAWHRPSARAFLRWAPA